MTNMNMTTTQKAAFGDATETTVRTAVAEMDGRDAVMAEGRSKSNASAELAAARDAAEAADVAHAKYDDAKDDVERAAPATHLSGAVGAIATKISSAFASTRAGASETAHDAAAEAEVRAAAVSDDQAARNARDAAIAAAHDAADTTRPKAEVVTVRDAGDGVMVAEAKVPAARGGDGVGEGVSRAGLHVARAERERTLADDAARAKREAESASANAHPLDEAVTAGGDAVMGVTGRIREGVASLKESVNRSSARAHEAAAEASETAAIRDAEAKAVARAESTAAQLDAERDVRVTEERTSTVMAPMNDVSSSA